MRGVTLKKFKYNQNCLVERDLPSKGEITVKIGDNVRSFDKLGRCMYSEQSEKLFWEGELLKKEGDMVFSNETLWVKKKLIFKIKEGKAPFTGVICNINTNENSFKLQRAKKEFRLISGVSGTVKDIIKGKAVLLSIKALEISAVAGKGKDVSGELIVLGSHNETPPENLFTEKLIKKIVVCGNLNTVLYARAKALGVSGFIVGSINYSTFKDITNGPSIVVTEGFGTLPFSPILFDFLKKIQSRFVFIRAKEAQAIIPSKEEITWANKMSDKIYTEISKGHVVQVFERDLYGKYGTVLNVGKDKVEVEIWGENKKVMVSPKSLGILFTQ